MTHSGEIVWPQFPGRTDPLRQWSALAPERIALVDRARGVRRTYAEFDDACDKWASVLRRRGILPGQRVGVIAGNRHEVAELFFACMRVGAALVPLNWRLAPRELSAILLHSQSSLVVGEARFLEGLDRTVSKDSMPPWLDLDVDAPAELAAVAPIADDVEARPDDAVLILYTSGSTGQPKGVIIPHRQILFNAMATTAAWELGHKDIAPVATPFFHTGGWNVLTTPLWWCQPLK